MAKSKTYMAKTGEIEAKWHLVDATDKIIGRLATRLSTILQGKHRPEYTPHVDTGDFIVVINASKVKHTGSSKLDERQYKRYSGYPSGQNITTAKEMLEKHPERIITEAVRRMLPKTKLGRAMLKKLKVFAGEQHDHQAQKPEPLEL
jgi:large subunit ribosomal protein L13